MDTTLPSLFSTTTFTYEIRGAALDESYLWPEEEKILGEVSDKRRWDFVSGRKCARIAMEQRGFNPVPVLSGNKDEPLWPDGVVGSITHTSNYAAAAIAPESEMLSLGLDAETDEPLPQNVLSRIGNDEEITWVHATRGKVLLHPGKLLFSAKEATYKAWYSVTQEWLGFRDTHVTFTAENQTFAVSISKAGPVRELLGRFGLTQGIILTAIEIPVLK